MRKKPDIINNVMKLKTTSKDSPAANTFTAIHNSPIDTSSTSRQDSRVVVTSTTNQED